MGDRYLEHCIAVLRRSKEEAEDGASCVLSGPEVDCIIDLLKEQNQALKREYMRGYDNAWNEIGRR